MNAIRTMSLTKRYGDKNAVDALELTVKQGELLALLGVNGAGKTTTVKMLSGLLRPTSGDAEILGYRLVSQTQEVKKRINLSPQETAVAPKLTVRENLELIAGIYGGTRAQAAERASTMLEEFHMQSVEKQKAGTLSGGWQRRLSIAMALITKPEILFLDEPTLGLDVLARRELWMIIERLKGKVTVILTTHYMEEAQNLCNRVALMDHGKLEEVSTPQALIESLGAYAVDEMTADGTQNHYFHTRQEAIRYLEELTGQASLRETTLEDVFVERAGKHLISK